MSTTPNFGEPPKWVEGLKKSKLGRVLRYPDFRLLWVGAFLSFTGSWVQNVAQGYFVFQLTHDESKLALTSFAWSVPVLVLGLVAGSIADRMDKRAVLVWTQVVFAVNAFGLAAATYMGVVQFWHILLVSFVNGVVSSIEMPTRQSIVSRVVSGEDLSAAVPVNAMTFNVARIVGPAIGGLLLKLVGVPACYAINGLSFVALIWAALAIKSDLKPIVKMPEPLIDLVVEGAMYTWRHPGLKLLLLMEAMTAVCGIAFMPLLPAYIENVVHAADAKQALGYAFTAAGIGAFLGLLVAASVADGPNRGPAVRWAMWTIGGALVLLCTVHLLWIAYVLFVVLGMATVLQFNLTNTLFQLIPPDRLRGRVLAMHIWALNGLSPFGVLFFGWLSKSSRTSGMNLPLVGIPLVLLTTGVLMIAAGTISMFAKRGFSELLPGMPLEGA